MGIKARVVMWGLFLGAGAAALAPAGPGALVPLKMAIASADSVGNDVYVAVVVDFGSGSSLSSVSKCVPVASNAHDSDALAAAVGSDNVGYSGSGLLCAIDEYPANGVQNCGQGVGSGDFDYWSYWHGATGTWVYGNDGPAEHPVATPPDDVEGWRFQVDEPDNASDPPPSVAPSYAQICNAATEVPPPGSPPPSTTTTTTAASSTPGVALVTPTTATANVTRGPATTTTTAVHSGAKSGVATTSTPGATTSTQVPGASEATGNGRHGTSGQHRPALAGGAAAHDGSGRGSSSNLLPVLLIAVVVVALAGFAIFRWRRRPAEE